LKHTVLIAALLLSGTLPCLAEDAVPSAEASAESVGAAIAARGPVACSFSESRLFPFRKTPTLLTGTSVFLPGKGLVIAYETPSARRIGVTSGGIVEEDASGKRSAAALPGRYGNLLALYSLDMTALSKDFAASFSSEASNWSLLLDEGAPVAQAGRGRPEKRGSSSIRVSGEGATVREIQIVRPGTITIVIDMGAARTPTPEELTRALELLGE